MKQLTRMIPIIFLYLFSGSIFAQPRILAGLIDPDNVNLSTRDFLTFYASNDPQEKENVLMYMLGVADATEGKTWCGYSRTDSAVLYQTALAYLHQQSLTKPKVRASSLIEEAFIKNYACRGSETPVKLAPRPASVLSLTPDVLNLSGNDFSRFWISGNEQEKLRAGIYLLGVEDATERKLWCGYDLFKTVTLNELVYISVKNKTHDELNSRAAKIILEKFMNYPCDSGGKE